MGLEHLGVHTRHHLTGLEKVALVHRDAGNPPSQFGGHVHFGGFDAPVGTGESVAQLLGLQFQPQGETGCDNRRYQPDTDDHLLGFQRRHRCASPKVSACTAVLGGLERRALEPLLCLN